MAWVRACGVRRAAVSHRNRSSSIASSDARWAPAFAGATGWVGVFLRSYTKLATRRCVILRSSTLRNFGGPMDLAGSPTEGFVATIRQLKSGRNDNAEDASPPLRRRARGAPRHRHGGSAGGTGQGRYLEEADRADRRLQLQQLGAVGVERLEDR